MLQVHNVLFAKKIIEKERGGGGEAICVGIIGTFEIGPFNFHSYNS